MVSGSEDSKVYIWDLQTREVLQVLEGHRGKCCCLQFILSASKTDTSFQMWSWQSPYVLFVSKAA